MLHSVDNRLTTFSKLSDINCILEISTIFPQKVFDFFCGILSFKNIQISLVNSLFLTSSFKKKHRIIFIIRLIFKVFKDIRMNDSLSFVEYKLVIFRIVLNRLDLIDVIAVSDPHLYFCSWRFFSFWCKGS